MIVVAYLEKCFRVLSVKDSLFVIAYKLALASKTTGTNTHESLLCSAIMLKVAQFNIALVCLTFSIGLNIITSPRSKSRSRTERFSGERTR